MAVFDINGNYLERNYDSTMLSVNHRGYSNVAPENTLPAYILSKQMGFNYVETDVSFTSDGVAMLLHDATIDRTSNGTGTLSEMTYDTVRQYDFGSWKSLSYVNTVIPTLEEFLWLCKSIMLHPYIELKSNGGYTQSQINSVVDMVRDYGLRGKVSYISFSDVFLGYVRDYDPDARLGYLTSTNGEESSAVTTCVNLKTGTNEVFCDIKYSIITEAECALFAAQGIPLEAWTVDTKSALLALPKYISGITSNTLIAGKVLHDQIIT